MTRRAYPAILIAFVLLLTLSGVAQGSLSKPSARKASVTKLNAYLVTHPWAENGQVGVCKRSTSRRVICGVTISGGTRTCESRVKVTLAKRAKARLGKLLCSEAPPRIRHIAAHLGSPKRDLGDPFRVTYPFSASSASQGFAAQGAGEDSLPNGVLALYSDGVLECALNVAGIVAGDECPITYAKLGMHRVTAIYTSGSESAVATEAHNVEPLPTVTTIEVGYEPLPISQSDFGCGDNAVCHQEIGPHENGGFDVGALDVRAAVTPWGTPPFSACPSADPNCIDLSLVDGAGEAHLPVTALAKFTRTEEKDLAIGETLAIEPEAVQSVSFAGLFGWPVADLEAGVLHFQVASGNRPGYSASEASVAVKLTPQVTSVVERVACGC